MGLGSAALSEGLEPSSYIMFSFYNMTSMLIHCYAVGASRYGIALSTMFIIPFWVTWHANCCLCVIINYKTITLTTFAIFQTAGPASNPMAVVPLTRSELIFMDYTRFIHIIGIYLVTSRIISLLAFPKSFSILYHLLCSMVQPHFGRLVSTVPHWVYKTRCKPPIKCI